MQGHADAMAAAPSSPTHHLCSGRDGGDGGGGGDCDEYGGGSHYFFFSAPASPVHYILRSPPASSASAYYTPAADGDSCAAAGDFEFAARNRGAGAGVGAGMSTAEELFLSGRIRVGCLSPIRQETALREQEEEYDDDDDEEEKEDGGVDGHAPRPRRARSVSPPRSPRFAKDADPPDSLASASSSLSSSAKNTRRRISLRDLLGRTCSDASSFSAAVPATTGVESSAGSWLPSIWPSRPKKALPRPAPQPGRRSTSSDRPAPAKRTPGREEFPRRRTTSLPYRQGLVLGCLGFGARSYGLAKSMHPLSSR